MVRALVRMFLEAKVCKPQLISAVFEAFGIISPKAQVTRRSIKACACHANPVHTHPAKVC